MTIYAGDVIGELWMSASGVSAEVSGKDLSTIRGEFLDSLTALAMASAGFRSAFLSARDELNYEVLR